MKIHALVIDPQHDFCTGDDMALLKAVLIAEMLKHGYTPQAAEVSAEMAIGPSRHQGSLVVPGADKDMERLATLITRIAPKLDDIHVTLDSHRIWDIAHPIWWKDSNGNHPAPFTVITVADVESGKWTTTRPGAYKRSLDYLKALAATKRYPHVIWPEHCLIGSWGHGVVPVLAEAMHVWERMRQGVVDYVTKGSNPYTEHFSGVRAEVPDPKDLSTQINSDLIRVLGEADIILLAGEARSHCLANTVRDIATEFELVNPDLIKKFYLLTDATSDVPTFEGEGEKFVREMVAKGMNLTTTQDFLR